MVPKGRSLFATVAIAALMAWPTCISQAQEVHPIVALAKKLAKPIDFPGLDNGASLADAMELLGKVSGVRIDINEQAFQQRNEAAAWAPAPGGDERFLVSAQDRGGSGAKPGVGDKGNPAGKGGVGDKGNPAGKGGAGDKLPPPKGPPPAARDVPMGVALEIPVGRIPPMKGVRLDTVLKKILSRAQSPAGPLDYVLRREGIEITTQRAKIAEFYRRVNHPPASPDPVDDNPDADAFRYLPLVQVEFARTLLDDALTTLANATDCSIVLDPKAVAEEKPKAVSATLINVPLDTAVELLANMAGLKVVMRDRVLYVTTKANADAMEKELRDRTPMLIQGIQGGGPGLGMGGMPLGPNFGMGGPGLGGPGLVGPIGPQPVMAAELAQLQAEVARLREELSRLRKSETKKD